MNALLKIKKDSGSIMEPVLVVGKTGRRVVDREAMERKPPAWSHFLILLT